MAKTLNRATTVGFLLAVVVSISVPGTANASDPALAGSCAATLRNGSGQPLTLDAGAPLDAPGVLSVGTGSDATPTGPARTAPLASLPLADVARATDLGDAPVAGRQVTDVACPMAQNTVNTLSAITQGLLAGTPPVQVTPPPPQPPGSNPPAGTPPPAGNTPPPEAGASTGGAGSALVFWPKPGPAGLPVVLPGTAGPATTGHAAPGTSPTVSTPQPETAEERPAPWPVPARLPLLLAALALVLVTGVLTRDWARRKAA